MKWQALHQKYFRAKQLRYPPESFDYTDKQRTVLGWLPRRCQEIVLYFSGPPKRGPLNRGWLSGRISDGTGIYPRCAPDSSTLPERTPFEWRVDSVWAAHNFDLIDPMGPDGPEKVIDLSQNLDRVTQGNDCTPCILPRGILFARRAFRLVEPNERLHLQGMPLLSKYDLAGFSQAEVSDLAGNAFSGQSVLACLIRRWFLRILRMFSARCKAACDS